MIPQEFYDLCARHDWYYAYSDDHRYWVAGEASWDRLKRLAATDPALQAILEAWSAYMFNGPSWGTETQPRPARPE